MALQTVNINGWAADRSSTVISLNGLSLWNDQITKVTYKTKLTKQKLHGGRMQPIGRTRGKLEPEASLTFYNFGFRDFVEYIRLQNPTVGYHEYVFQMQVQYRNQLGLIQTDLVNGCNMQEVGFDSGEGENASMVEVPLDCMMVFLNGISPISADQVLR